MAFLSFVVFVLLVAYGVYRIVTQREKEALTFSKGFGAFGLAVVFLLFSLSLSTVNAGSRGVVTRWGNVNRTLDPGLHLVLPIAESVHTITTQTLVVKPSEDAASHDLQIVHMQVTLAYHFDPAFVDYIFTHLSDSSENAVENKVINPAVLEAMKSQTAQYDAQHLIDQRPKVRDGIELLLQEKLAQYHIIPETVSITDFNFSKDYNDAIEAKQTAQQRSEKAQNDLTRIQIEAQQQIAQAKGEAEALRAQKEQITPELLQLRTIEMLKEKWDGHLPENYYGGSAPLPMMEVLKNKSK